MECSRVEADAKVSNAGISITHTATQTIFSYFCTKNWHADADVVSNPKINRHHLLQEADMAVFPVT
jgi:hypothetical protein